MTSDVHLLDVTTETLADAIQRLRYEPDYSRNEVANDLALLHARLSLRNRAVARRERLRLVREDELRDEEFVDRHARCLGDDE